MYDTATTANPFGTHTGRAGQQRSAFSDGDLDTASPAKVLVKCFDRLDADLDRAMSAIEGHDHETANRELGHAQDLLGEVAAMIDVDAWEHAASLLSVYDYVLRLLAVGNIMKDIVPVSEARHILAEIGDGFRSAADEVAASSTPIARPTPDAPAGGSFDAATPAAAPQRARAGGFSVLA